MNFGKLAYQIQAWRDLAVGAVITFVVLVAALLAPWHFDSRGAVLGGFLGFFLLVGLLLLVPGLISVRQLQRPGNVPAGVSQFVNTDQWNVKVTLPPATAATGETVVDWLGPMIMFGRGFSNTATTVLSKETDRNPFNTLLVTDAQLIGILLGPDDLSGVEGGPVRDALTTMINQSPQSTHGKLMQFGMVNRTRWGQIVASATADGLEAVLADHLNFGLPYSEVQSFSVSHHVINPGLVFTLRDGRKMKCAAMARKKLLDRVAESLSHYVMQT